MPHPSSPGIGDKLKTLLASQYSNPESLKEFQWKKLEKLIAHAYANVPYYKALFSRNGIRPRNIQSPEDLARIPLLSKRIIRRHSDELVSADVQRSQLHVNYTGGSTGEPLKFYQDRNYLEWADAARTRAWKYFPGFDQKEREALLWGADRDLAHALTLRQMLAIVLKRGNLKLNTFSVTVRQFRRFAVLLNLMRYRVLRGYASSLVDFCNYLLKTGYRIDCLASVVSSAETLTPHDRMRIEETLCARVYDSYGSREVSQIAMECENQSGLHIVMENQFVEVQDGRILVTNLNNYAMPFIRYEIGDLSDGIVSGDCGCGRGLIRLANVRGRVSDVLRFGETSVHAEYITHLFYTDTKISRFQIVKNEKANRLRILIDKPDPSIESRLEERLREKLPKVAVEVVVTDQFSKTRTGKLRVVVDEDDS